MTEYIFDLPKFRARKTQVSEVVGNHFGLKVTWNLSIHELVSGEVIIGLFSEQIQMGIISKFVDFITLWDPILYDMINLASCI